jgi:hypothetical protein
LQVISIYIFFLVYPKPEMSCRDRGWVGALALSWPFPCSHLIVDGTEPYADIPEKTAGFMMRTLLF